MIDFNKPMLVFQTDFTYKEGAVCAMYGVVKSVDRTLEIIDGTHELPQYDTYSASYRLMQSMKFWPQGTIFVSVVDPGVGTARKACVAKTKDGYYIVTPDNGSLTHVALTSGIEEVREIDETINRLKGKDTETVSIFHGRDLFGYCAARLASGIISYEQVGPTYPVEEIVMHTLVEPTVKEDIIECMFEINDPNFGNLWTNVTKKQFNDFGLNYGDKVETTIFHHNDIIFKENVVYVSSFGDAPKGSVIIYNNELNKVAMAVSVGNLVDEYALGYGSDWKVKFRKVNV